MVLAWYPLDDVYTHTCVCTLFNVSLKPERSKDQQLPE